MEAQLRSRLLADNAIVSLVGQRVDWFARPQGKPLPAITINYANDALDQHMGGVQSTRRPWVQIDCWADASASPAAAAAALNTLRDAVLGILETPATQNGIRFLRAQDIRHSGSSERTETGLVARTMIQATIWHTT